MLHAEKASHTNIHAHMHTHIHNTHNTLEHTQTNYLMPILGQGKREDEEGNKTTRLKDGGLCLCTVLLKPATELCINTH